MKNLILALLILLTSLSSYAQSVSINEDGAAPSASALLDIKSTTKGMLIPRMTSAQRTGIANPVPGLLVYDNETASFWYYKAAGWTELVGGGGGADASWSTSGSNIYNNNTGNIGIGTNAPLSPLHIKKDNEAFRIQGATPYFSFYDNAGAYKAFIQNNNDNLLFGTPASNPNSKLEFYNGNVKNMSLDGFGSLDLSGSQPFLSLINNGTRSGYLYGFGKNVEIAAYKDGAATAGNLILQADEAAVGGTLVAGNVGIGTYSPVEKLTVQTGNNSYGISHRGAGGNLLATRMGGTSAGIGTFSHTNMRIFANNYSAIFIAEATGNVGLSVDDDNPLYKLDVGGRIRLRTQSDGNSAGVWLNNPANTAPVAFMGIADAFTTGFYGTVSGWGLIMNVNTGNVGIGTLNPTYKLSVNGNIRAKELVVENDWADYVFDDAYKLKSLTDLEKFIREHKHLPNIPSSKEVQENGLHVGEVQKRMMEKIEELSLYIIEVNKKIELLEQKLKEKN